MSIKYPRVKPVVTDWIREHKDISNRLSARLIMKEIPGLFTKEDTARKYISALRNPKRKRSKDMIPIEDCIRTKDEIRNHEYNTTNNRLPKADDTDFAIRELPSEANKWLILADVHIPYYDESALWCAIEYGKKVKCNGILQLGDWNDFYQLSNFIKDPRKRCLVEEVAMSNEIDDILIKEIKPKAFVKKLGNHEFRLERYIMSRTPELLGLEGITFEGIFKTKEKGIKVISASDPIRYKTLTLIHGSEYAGGWVAPVNPARGMFLRSGGCVVSAHQHVTSEHTETNIMSVITTCWSIGSLCNLHPDYRPLNKWNHGFGVLSTGKGKYWHFENKRIVKGKVL